MMRYYLEYLDENDRQPVGDWRGYATLEDAQKVAKSKVDDAQPNIKILILARIGHAWFGGDGEPNLSMETKDEPRGSTAD